MARRSNHLAIHQRVRSAIHDTRQPTPPTGFLSLKLPPPPCAVLLVSIFIYIYLPLSISTYLPFSISIYLSIHPYLSLSISIHPFLSLSIPIYLPEKSNYARLPSEVKSGRSKTKHFCETSFAKKIECRADGLVSMRFEFFPFNSSKVVCLLPKSEARSSDAAPVKQNHLRKLEDPMLQNATPLRKSAP